MGSKLVEKVLKICSQIWYWEKKKIIRGHIFKKTSFHVSLFGNGLTRDFELKFGTMKYCEILVILPKLGLMNHCNNFFLQVYYVG
jgi:hypothetical protein